MRYSALSLLLLASCISEDHTVQDLLTPDQFHIFYTDGSGDSSGSSARGGPGKGDPWSFAGESSGDFNSWTAGFTWDLIGPNRGAAAMHTAARAMQTSARLMAQAASLARSAPEPVVIVEAPEATPAPVVPQEPVQVRLPAVLEAALLAWVSRPAPEPIVAPVASGESSERVVVVQPGAAPDITITVAPSNVIEQGDPKPAGGGKDPDDDEPQGVLLLGISSEVWTQLIIAVGILATAIGGYLGRKKIPGVRELTKEGREKRKATKAAKEGR